MRSLIKRIWRKSPSFVVAGVVACTSMAATPVLADSVDIVSVGGTEIWGSYTGTLTYQYHADGTTPVADLTVTLTNTSDPSNGGYITGFVFNVRGDATAKLYPNPQFVNAGDTHWSDGFWDVNAPEDANPFAPFEAGAALAKKDQDGVFLGAGNPTKGIAVGQTASFTFNVTGADAPYLSVWDFVTEASLANDGREAVFLARFRGFENGESNKSHAVPIPPVPSPTAAMGGLLLLGCSLLRRQ